MNINGFSSITEYDAVYNGNLAFKGFPCESKNGSSLILTTPLAMSSQSANKDGAWRFMRTVLTEGSVQSRYSSSDNGFPTTQKLFDQAVQKAMTENHNENDVMSRQYSLDGNGWSQSSGSVVVISNNDGEAVSDEVLPKLKLVFADKTIDVFALTQTQLDRFMEMLNTIDHGLNYDQTLGSMVQEECVPFFAGQKTAEDVVKIIQSRVNIYVNEQR
jgi:ABC-type glycerol-3-phosphate transport system substrate-binding protein